MNGCRKGEINSPLPRNRVKPGDSSSNIQPFYVTSSSSLFFVLLKKKAKKLAFRPQEGDFLRISLASCQTPGFLNVIIPCPNISSSNLLAYHMASRMSLDSVTQILNKKWRWKTFKYNMKGKVKSLSHVWLFETPRTVAHQAPPSLGFSRQEYWSGLPFPSPGDLPDPGIEPGSPAL